MSYEVDIRGVGTESSSGDAIVLRFGDYLNNPEDQKIVIIDGGFKDSGEDMVNFIQEQYGTNKVDLVISTHPDNDHVSGLHTVFEKMEVGELLIHRPWAISDSLDKRVKNRVTTNLGIASKLEKSLECAYDLEQLAIKNHIPIAEPFQGLSRLDGRIIVLGPSEEFYREQVVEFEKSSSFSLVEKTKRIISEVWHRDELAEPESTSTSARNNSSAIILAALDDANFLFTADAGISALNHVADYTTALNFDLPSQIKYQQIPHHGSKRNVGPSVLDRIIGPILAEGATHPFEKTTFISCAAKGAPKHPSTRVINSLIRRGAKVAVTRGQHHCFRSLDIPARPNWYPITHEQFAHSHEEED